MNRKRLESSRRMKYATSYRTVHLDMPETRWSGRWSANNVEGATKVWKEKKYRMKSDWIEQKKNEWIHENIFILKFLLISFWKRLIPIHFGCCWIYGSFKRVFFSSNFNSFSSSCYYYYLFSQKYTQTIITDNFVTVWCFIVWCWPGCFCFADAIVLFRSDVLLLPTWTRTRTRTDLLGCLNTPSILWLRIRISKEWLNKSQSPLVCPRHISGVWK